MFGIRNTMIRALGAIDRYVQGATQGFPERGIGLVGIAAALMRLNRELLSRSLHNNLGWLITYPHPAAVAAYAWVAAHNPNNLGNWTIGAERLSGTPRMEHEVIDALRDLYHADNTVGGYVTSGATEANLFATWVGREDVRKHIGGHGTLMMAVTSLTHYSVTKAAAICGVETTTVPLSDDTWGMDVSGLASRVRRLYARGVRGLLVPLTIGYTTTGTSDDVGAITAALHALTSELPGFRCFVWIDAALNGLTEPFLTDAFLPFANPMVSAFVVDFHKFGRVPYGAGAVLYGKRLVGKIQRKVGYLAHADATVIGSRPGAAAASAWTMIRLMGKGQYRSIATRCVTEKNHFIRGLSAAVPGCRILTSPGSVHCGIIFPGNARLPDSIANAYGLYAATETHVFRKRGMVRMRIYKWYFLPHVTSETVHRCLTDIGVWWKGRQ